MTAPAPFGSQFLVNAVTSGGEDSPSVAALANGDFVVAWEDNAAGTNDGKYRVYHADGTPLTGELPLNTSLAGNQGRPVVAPLTDGRFAVAWRDDASGSFDIKAHVYNSDGTPAGKEFLVNNVHTSGNQQEPAIAALAGGGFVVSWTSFVIGDDDIYARAFNAAGTALGDEFNVANNPENETQSTVTGLTNGSYVIAWTDGSGVIGDTSGTHIEASIFSGNGTPAGPTNFHVNTLTTAGDQTDPLVIGISEGEFLVAWTTPYAGDLDIDGKFYSAAGISRVDGEFGLVTTGDSDQTQVSLAAVNDQFFSSWTDSRAISGADSSGSHVGAMLTANDLSAESDQLLANRAFVNDNQFESSVAALFDGRVLVVWTDGGLSPGAPDPAPNAVYGQIFDPRTAAVSLVGHGLLNDEWVGTRFNDAMDGFAGNDRIDGAAGNDNLFGGIGNDSLISGPGADLMRGGPGNDTYSVDNLGDVVDEGVAGSSGLDRVLSAISFSLADAVHAKGAIESLTLTGSAGINGTGNDLANVITGNGGANILNGALGNDTLTGGAGKDLFVFNTAFKPAANIDIITDYVVADDTIELENALFTKLKKVGALKDKFFEIGRHAGDGNDYLVYNKKTGVLSYDKDGDGQKHGIAIAQLTDHLQLTGADFLVI